MAVEAGTDGRQVRVIQAVVLCGVIAAVWGQQVALLVLYHLPEVSGQHEIFQWTVVEVKFSVWVVVFILKYVSLIPTRTVVSKYHQIETARHFGCRTATFLRAHQYKTQEKRDLKIHKKLDY